MVGRMRGEHLPSCECCFVFLHVTTLSLSRKPTIWQFGAWVILELKFLRVLNRFFTSVTFKNFFLRTCAYV